MCGAPFQIMACYAIRTLLETASGEEALLKLGGSVDCSRHSRRNHLSHRWWLHVWVAGLAAELVQCYTNHKGEQFMDLHYMLLILVCEVAANADGRHALSEGGANTIITSILSTMGDDQIDVLKWGCAAVASFADDNEEGQKAMLAEGVISVSVNSCCLDELGHGHVQAHADTP
jgi:hypothetical protein